MDIEALKREFDDSGLDPSAEVLEKCKWRAFSRISIK